MTNHEYETLAGIMDNGDDCGFGIYVRKNDELYAANWAHLETAWARVGTENVPAHVALVLDGTCFTRITDDEYRAIALDALERAQSAGRLSAGTGGG